MLGGSWVAINGLISKVTKLVSHIRGLISGAIHEPPSRGGSRFLYRLLEGSMQACEEPLNPKP